MDLFLFHRDEWESIYNNCSHIDITPFPWAQRRHILESIALITITTIQYLLYLPCLYSFWKNLRDEKGPNACYQLMFYISIVDMSALWIIGIYDGVQFLLGNVYCAHPYANYVLGKLVQSLVMIEIVADVVLALNRCTDIISSHYAAVFFKGKRIWFWIVPTMLNGLYSFFFIPPVVFNGFTIAFTNHPYLGFWDDNDNKFEIPLHLVINNGILFFGTPIIYILFLIALGIKTTAFKTNNHKISKIQRSAFFQVFAISLFNMLAGSLYDLKEQFPGIISPQFIFIAHLSWVEIHGIPPVIYIIFNKTVQNDIKMLYMKTFKASRVSHIHGVTILVPVSQQRESQMTQRSSGGNVQRNQQQQFTQMTEMSAC